MAPERGAAAPAYLAFSPGERQSKLLLERAADLYAEAGRPGSEHNPLVSINKHEMHFRRGGSILALPGSEKTVRGYTADLVIIDEAARVDDSLYYSVRPMLATTGGELVALTTPNGKRGWFYDEYEKGAGDWQRIRITANECPRISSAFLDEERRRMPDAWFRSEYLCEFTEALDSVFRSEDIERAFSADVKLLFAATDDQGRAPQTAETNGVAPLLHEPFSRAGSGPSGRLHGDSNRREGTCTHG